MTYDAKSRDRYRRAVTGVTGALAASVLVGTGAISGQAARDLNQQEAAEQAKKAEEYAAWQAEQAAYDAEVARLQAENPPVVVKQRPKRTRVTTRYVSGGSPSGVSVGSSSGSRNSGGSSNSGGNTAGGRGGGNSGGGAGPTPAPPPPPPPPPPASNGS